MNNLITIKTATSSSQLTVMQSYLEDNGIACYMKDFLMGEMYPPVSAAGGVQLQVQEEDVARALELLIAGEFITEDEYKEYSDPLTRFVEKVLAKLNDK